MFNYDRQKKIQGGLSFITTGNVPRSSGYFGAAKIHAEFNVSIFASASVRGHNH